MMVGNSMLLERGGVLVARAAGSADMCAAVREAPATSRIRVEENRRADERGHQ
jgi:hypothetical protein